MQKDAITYLHFVALKENVSLEKVQCFINDILILI